MRAQVLVVGLGPAGRALAHRCRTRGLAVVAVDPRPDRPWTATYAAWRDELPEWLDPGAVAATVEAPVAWARREFRIDRPYSVLDSGRLRDSLSLAGAEIVADRAVRLTRRAVTLASGRRLTADRVIDARGIPRSPRRAEQTAYGVLVEGSVCEPFFMDWRPDNGADPEAPPSFLYAVPLAAGTMLLEETCLAGRPALSHSVLRERLIRRLRSRAIPFTEEVVERVRFPVQGARPARHAFGAAGGFTHPATGYSVAATLCAADAVAAGDSPASLSARAVHALRIAGLRTLLTLPPADIPLFFELFFELPAEQQRAYLSGRSDLPGTAAAMRALFAAAPARVRRVMAHSLAPENGFGHD
ncbi:lycopene cyclase [Nocardia panacis]|uniref:Lycopene cyclase n=1 Tax=Nocardia panacis TaxID=2340916 RepID=A0A3A4JRI5_9NOCA|nr:lycopene cyclase family protein [Nocardia panacis]RJO68271.1 lycopene cyclase [Nocardia panacis]